MRERKGFTLIELLVVIAIIAILAAILFPVFIKARASAMTSQCISNMHQFGLAIQTYRDSNNAVYPWASNIWEAHLPGLNYFETLGPYMKNREVSKCKAQAITAVKGSLVNLWYYDGAAKTKPSVWHGTVYTPSMHVHKADGSDKIGRDAMAHLPWVVYGRAVNPDSFDYRGTLKCQGASQAIILFCMSGTWICNWDAPHIRQMFPDGIAHGSHELGTPALFADQHVKFVNYRRVGNL